MADNEAPQGVIHDIGFRHYDGERLGRGWIVRSLLVETFRGVFGLGRPAKAKIMPWVLIGILLAPPLVFALVAVILGLDTLPTSYTAYLPGSMTLNGGGLTDAVDADAGAYAPAPVAQISVSLGDLTGGSGAQTIEFTVTID